MKLNLYPKEFLALYSLLEDRMHSDFEDPSLREIHGRMRAYVLNALGSRDEESAEKLMGVWVKSQQRKIDQLNEENQAIMSSAQEASFLEESLSPSISKSLKSGKRFTKKR